MARVKWIPQSESSECGLACLAMLAEHYGHAVGLRAIRDRFGGSTRGMGIGRLVDIAGQLGLRARPVRVELEHLQHLELPCVLHWDLEHFVVLTRAGRSGIRIVDPALGERDLRHEEASAHFTGVALEVAPTSEFRPVSAAPAVSVRQLVGRVERLWSAVGLLLLLSVVLQVFALVAPFYLQWVIDQVLVSGDGTLLTALGLGFAFLVVLQAAVSALRGWAVSFLSARLNLQWSANVFGHLLRLPLDFFGKRHLGDVVSRMGAVDAMQRTLTTSFVEVVIDGMMALATLTIMLMYSPMLTLVAMGAIAAYLLVRLALFRPMRVTTEQHLLAVAQQSSFLFESVRGIQSIKVASRESWRQAGYMNLMHETTWRQLRLARLGIGFSTANQVLFGIERIVVIWLGAHLAMRNVFSVGMLMAFLAYKDQFAQRVAALIDKGIELQMLRLHGERLADIVFVEPEQTQGTAGAVPIGSMRIEARGLSFRYSEGEPWILRDCSFVVEDGESVAITGPSGCGKTTLVKILLGLLQPTAGTIEVGGVDLRTLGLHAHRGMVGAVMQDDQLFAGTVADNIAFHDERVDPARVEQAARLAAVHEEIRAMPMGYNTLIGDMGTSLSGGQRQRVILARALYPNPRLLVLDEATSHLDVERERTVNAAVAGLRQTRIIIAHRRETIESADRILVMERGAIAQAGHGACPGGARVAAAAAESQIEDAGA